MEFFDAVFTQILIRKVPGLIEADRALQIHAGFRDLEGVPLYGDLGPHMMRVKRGLTWGHHISFWV